jgi:hypothetical protein
MNEAAAGRIGKVAPPKLAPPDAFGKSRAPGPGRSLGDRIVGPARSWKRNRTTQELHEARKAIDPGPVLIHRVCPGVGLEGGRWRSRESRLEGQAW